MSGVEPEGPHRQRSISFVIVMLMYGVVVNVLVGAACAIWGSVADTLTSIELPYEGDWPSPIATWPAPTAKTTYGSATMTLEVYQSVEKQMGGNGAGPVATHYQWFYRSGWPMRTLGVEMRASPDAPPYVHAGWGPVPEWISSRRRSLRVVPTRIIWPGLIVGSALHAALLASLWLGATSARRLIRRARGHCPHCNYNLHANTTGTCPECGAQCSTTNSERETR